LYGSDALYGLGAAAGPYDEYGNPNNGGWGTESFSYLGPVPEPSAVALCGLGGVSLVVAWRRYGSKGCFRGARA
jgi:hypothetical protein